MFLLIRCNIRAVEIDVAILVGMKNMEAVNNHRRLFSCQHGWLVHISVQLFISVKVWWREVMREFDGL